MMAEGGVQQATVVGEVSGFSFKRVVGLKSRKKVRQKGFPFLRGKDWVERRWIGGEQDAVNMGIRLLPAGGHIHASLPLLFTQLCMINLGFFCNNSIQAIEESHSLCRFFAVLRLHAALPN